jgi:HD-like signal output (HDOD) protein
MQDDRIQYGNLTTRRAAAAGGIAKDTTRPVINSIYFVATPLIVSDTRFGE